MAPFSDLISVARFQCSSGLPTLNALLIKIIGPGLESISRVAWSVTDICTCLLPLITKLVGAKLELGISRATENEVITGQRGPSRARRLLVVQVVLTISEWLAWLDCQRATRQPRSRSNQIFSHQGTTWMVVFRAWNGNNRANDVSEIQRKWGRWTDISKIRYSEDTLVPDSEFQPALSTEPPSFPLAEHFTNSSSSQYCKCFYFRVGLSIFLDFVVPQVLVSPFSQSRLWAFSSSLSFESNLQFSGLALLAYINQDIEQRGRAPTTACPSPRQNQFKVEICRWKFRFILRVLWKIEFPWSFRKR